MKIINLFILVALFLVACNPSTSNTESNNTKNYRNEDLGWTIPIPTIYQALSKAELEALYRKEQILIGKMVGNENARKLHRKYLVNFQRNSQNRFQSAIEQISELNKDISYSKMDQIAVNLYNKQNAKIDTLAGEETVDGVLFHTFAVKVHMFFGLRSANHIFYRTKLKGYYLTVIMISNNEKDRDLLLTTFRNSEFNE